MPDMLVRRASVQDLDIVVPLFDAYRRFYRKPTDAPLARSFLLDRLSRGESTVLIAEDAGAQAAGFAQLYPSFSSASAARIYILNDLFVRPESRGKGAGRLLLDAAAEFARDSGAVRLTLSTEVNNEKAQRLYEAKGWIRQTDFFVYTLPLAPARLDR